MRPGEHAPAAYVCTDSAHPLKLAQQDLLAIGLTDDKEEQESGISTMIIAKNIAAQGYYGAQFTNPAPSAENDDGSEEVEEEKLDEQYALKEKREEKQHSIVLEKQISRAPCVQDDSFGMVLGSSIMWVEKGCQGKFITTYGKSFDCVSVEYARAECKIPPSDEEELVEEERQALNFGFTPESGVQRRLGEMNRNVQANKEISKDFNSSWEFDPDVIEDENDHIQSITVASGLILRTNNFPAVCGASDFEDVEILVKDVVAKQYGEDINVERLVNLRGSIQELDFTQPHSRKFHPHFHDIRASYEQR